MTSNDVFLLPTTHDCYLPAMPLLRGDIYRYEDGFDKNYVGATRHVEKRRGEWVCTSSDYAGAKIAAARKITPPDKWEYYSFPVFDTDPDRLDQRLKEYESYYIAEFDSFENGYNGNRGGKGIAAWVLFRVTDASGVEEIVQSYEAASKLSGVPIGSISYIAQKDDHLAKNGVKIERLN